MFVTSTLNAIMLWHEQHTNLLGVDPNFDSGALMSITTIFPTSLGRVGTLDRGLETSVYEAFKATAVAAQHHKLDDQVNLLASCNHKLGSVLSLLHDGCQLSSNNV